MTVTPVTTNEQAITLAKHLMDPYRDRVAIVVSQTTQLEQRYDAERIARETSGAADVYAMQPGKVNLTFSDYLPENKTVFGGAVRIYGKGTDWMRNYNACPLYFAYNDQEAADRIGGLIDRACELSYVGLARAAVKEPELVTQIAAAAKTIHAPSPLALMGGRVSVTAPAAIHDATDSASVTVDEPAAAPVAATISSELPPQEDPRDAKIRELTDELTVQQFRFEQLEHEHREEISGLRARIKTEFRKAQHGGPSVRTLLDMRSRMIDMQAQIQSLQSNSGRDLVTAQVENAELRRKLAEQDDLHRARIAAARKKTTKPADEAPASAWAPALFATAEDAVRHAIQVTWVQRVPAHDKATYPLPDYELGPEFAASLDKLDNGSVTKALRCAVDVLTDLARDLPARRVHPLRNGEGGENAPRTRADGAVCFRASVESNVASARRLHYWKLGDGRIELSRVVLHDDMAA